jgi:phosphatidylserine decarboxylase
MSLPSEVLGRLAAWAQYPVPHHLVSRLVGVATQQNRPWVRDPLIHWFIRRYGVDLSEAHEPTPEAYPDFQSFFTRALRPGARPLCPGDEAVACPADGRLSQLGDLDDGTSLRAKGAHFDLADLLGGSPQRAAPFRGGSYATVYLSPRDYHRVHMPVDGVLREMVHIPGRAFSVNPATTAHVPGLFARNERVVARFDTANGPMALVLVGAMLVASIATVWAGTITPPRGRRVRQWTYPEGNGEAITLAQGEEMGRFNLGSTVIALFGPDQTTWAADVAEGQAVQMGQCMGRLRAATPEAEAPATAWGPREPA